jgi:hypothetical protein
MSNSPGEKKKERRDADECRIESKNAGVNLTLVVLQSSGDRCPDGGADNCTDGHQRRTQRNSQDEQCTREGALLEKDLANPA